MTYRDMSETTRITYLRSEIVVSTTIYETAAQILCARMQTGEVTRENMDAGMEDAVHLALELAVKTEQVMNN